MRRTSLVAATAAIVAAVVLAGLLFAERRDDARLDANEADPWPVAHPWETALGAGLLVLVVGCLVVIALNSERRRD